jgi:hypothetical protein
MVPLLGAQTPPPPQTARQALIEMFFGTAPKHLEKHLPSATLKSLTKFGNGQDTLMQLSMMASQIKAGGGKFETFDVGPILLAAEDPQNERVEITVERDDLIGDDDEIELALHITKNAKEQALPFIPRFTFSMKNDSDIWRLSEVSVTVRMPLTDPSFLKTIEDQQRGENEQLAMGWVKNITAAEKSYHAAHGAYACTLAGLNSQKQAYLDPELAAGKKSGYVFAVTACDASHYKLAAEPAVVDAEERAFCTDEDGIVRASSDGKAVSCLSRGEPVNDKNGQRATGVGFAAPD